MAPRQQRPPPSSLAPKPTAVQVGNEFVVSYYAALRNSPAQFQNFYQHNSLVGRPDPYGVVYTANKKQAINRDILSVGDGRPVEIKAVDAQYSVDCGVIVVAKGYLIGDGGVKRGFTQSFFLEPKVLTAKVQRYYISNDIIMYEDGEHLNQYGMAMANGSGVAQHANEENSSSVLTTSMAPVAEESICSVAPVAKVIFSAVPVAPVIKASTATSVAPVAKVIFSAVPVAPVIKASTATSVAPAAKVIFSAVPTIKTSLSTSVAPVAVATPVAPVIKTSTATSVAPVITMAASVAQVAAAPVDKTLMTEKSPSTVQGDVQAPMADKSSSSIMQGDAPKKSFPRSFASIVKDLRDNPAPFALPPSAPAKPLAPARPKSSNQRNGASARQKPSNQRNGPHPGTPSMVDNFGLNFKFPNYAGSSGRRGDAKAAYSRSNGHSGNSQSVAPPKLYFC